jgi:hypothetical protein
MVRRYATLLLLIACGCAARAPRRAGSPPEPRGVPWDQGLAEIDVGLIEELPWDRGLVETQSALVTAEPRLVFRVDDAEAQRRGEFEIRQLHVSARGWHAELNFGRDERALQEIVIRGNEEPDPARADAVVARLPRRFPRAETGRTFEAMWRVPDGELAAGVGRYEGRWWVRETFHIAATGLVDERRRALAEGEDPEAALTSFQARFGPPVRSKRTWNVHAGERFVELLVYSEPSPLFSSNAVSWLERIGRMGDPRARGRP